jgi:hypothetical protein
MEILAKFSKSSRIYNRKKYFPKFSQYICGKLANSRQGKKNQLMGDSQWFFSPQIVFFRQNLGILFALV